MAFLSSCARSSAPELDMQLDIAPTARGPGTQLVVADDLGLVGPPSGDRHLDPIHLLRRRRLIDEDARGPADDVQAGEDDEAREDDRDGRVELFRSSELDERKGDEDAR